MLVRNVAWGMGVEEGVGVAVASGVAEAVLLGVAVTEGRDKVLRIRKEKGPRSVE